MASGTASCSLAGAPTVFDSLPCDSLLLHCNVHLNTSRYQDVSGIGTKSYSSMLPRTLHHIQEIAGAQYYVLWSKKNKPGSVDEDVEVHGHLSMVSQTGVAKAGLGPDLGLIIQCSYLQ